MDAMRAAVRAVRAWPCSVTHIMPKKRWFLPPTWLLPRDIPFHNTIKIGVKGWNDKIAYFKSNPHNLLSLPFILRYIWGWSIGTAGMVIEPAIFQIQVRSPDLCGCSIVSLCARCVARRCCACQTHDICLLLHFVIHGRRTGTARAAPR